MVILRESKHTDLSHQFLDYMLRPKVNAAIVVTTKTATCNGGAQRELPDSLRQNPIFPGVCRRLETLQLLKGFERSAISEELRAGSDVLPTQQPAHELRGGYGLNLPAQRPNRQAMNARQQSPVAPFDFVTRNLREFSAQDRTARFQTQQGLLDISVGKIKKLA